MFPSPQGSHSRKERRWSPMATKTFPAISKCSGLNARPTPHLTPQSQQLLPTNPLSSSHPPQRLMGPTQKNKENAIIHIGIWKDCLCIPQKVKGLSIYQSCQDRAQGASCALTPLPFLVASFKHHFRGNPPPVFLAAGQLQTMLFWHHLPHPLWVCNPHQSYWKGARKSFATPGLLAYKTWKIPVLHTATGNSVLSPHNLPQTPAKMN